MEQQFLSSNYQLVDNTENADIYVINTCTVTNVAERKSRQMIRRAKQLNRNSIIVVCGCYVEVSRDEVKALEEVDLVLDDKQKKNIVENIEEFLNTKKFDLKEAEGLINNRIISGSEKENQEFVEYGSVTFTEKNRAVIKIQDGCNMFCTYCIIPYARGRIRSRERGNIVEEIKKIAKKGIKEVVLTGIHIASYGKDWKNSDIRLIDLLEEINKIDGIERIRLGSLEPTIITEEFLNRLSKLEKICHHFHLSLQSGCDATLKRMNRKYSISQFRGICELLRKTYSDVNLTTDIIVGFPGETNEEFEDTYNFLSEIKFYKMHIFKYSPRKGTIAAKMPNQIDGNIKEERSRKLIELSNKNQNDYHETYIEKNIDVLFEEIEDGFLKGHSSNYMEVKVSLEKLSEPKENFINQIKSVKIVENDDKTMELIGKML